MLLSLSHTDLDGIGSQIVLRELLGISTKMNTSYGKIDEYLDNVNDYCYHNNPKYVFITDLSFNDKLFDKLKNIADNFLHITFVFIDHHPFGDTTKWKSNNLKIIITSKASATKLVFKYLMANKKEYNINNLDYTRINEMEDFVEMVNAYDIWLEKENPTLFKKGFFLNELFWEYGINHFYSRFSSDFKIRNNDKETYKDIVSKKNKQFKKIEESGKLLKIGDEDLLMIFTDSYHAFVTIDFPGYKIYVILTSNGRVSVRLKDFKNAELVSKNLQERVRELESVSECGGHEKAFGISLINNEPKVLLNFAKEFMFIVGNEIKENVRG